MADETFETFVTRERARLHSEREAISQQQQELDNKFADLNRQLQAIEAYEAARSGKATPPHTRSSGTRSPRGAKREQLLQVIREGSGLKRAEISRKDGP